MIYELFVGRPFFAANTILERLNLREKTAAPELGPEFDPRLAAIINACLEEDPAARPRTVLSVAAILPGGDPLAAAVAEGRVPSPAMVASAAKHGALDLPIAWALVVAQIIGVVAVAWQAHVLTIPASAVPKPPQVLVERSREILSRIAPGVAAVDSDAWFSAASSDTEPISVRFVYRQSPRPLVPANLFRIVTETDPPANVPGMASVTVDASARLVGFSRVPDPEARGESGLTTDWTTLFREAGLDQQDFVRIEPDRRPLVPHDSLLVWARRSNGSTALRVYAATLSGTPVHFNVAGDTIRALPFRGGVGSGRPPAGEALLWLFFVSGFVAMTVIARRNLRAGEGDRPGARKLSIFMICAGVLNMLLRAHHVPLGQEELVLALGVTGWALVWGGFSWLAYVSFEPYVRRLWPGTLISWTRLLSARVRDPLVGRDVLVGALGGVVTTGLLILQLHLVGDAARDEFLGPALESLRSARQDVAIRTWAVLDGTNFAMGSLFFVLLVRMLIRKTWIAVGVLIVLNAPLIPGGTSGILGLFGAMTLGLVGVAILLRIGLLAFVMTQICERLLRHTAITLDPDSWYFGSSVVTILLVTAIAVYGFIVSLGGRPVFGAKVPPQVPQSRR